MFSHNTRLQYSVHVAACSLALANLMLEQFGGSQGERAVAMRYFSHALGEDAPGRKNAWLDISTEELSHLEIIGSIVGMLNKGAKSELGEAVDEDANMSQGEGDMRA